MKISTDYSSLNSADKTYECTIQAALGCLQLLQATLQPMCSLASSFHVISALIWINL